MLPYDGTKYSLFEILKIYSRQTILQYTQFFKVNVNEKENKYYKIEILKDFYSGDKIKIKLNDIT